MSSRLSSGRDCIVEAACTGVERGRRWQEEHRASLEKVKQPRIALCEGRPRAEREIS
jgi:hypothetical protein